MPHGVAYSCIVLDLYIVCWGVNRGARALPLNLSCPPKARESPRIILLVCLLPLLVYLSFQRIIPLGGDDCDDAMMGF